MPIDGARRLWLLNPCHQACFGVLGTDEKYDHIFWFRRAFLIKNLHGASVLLSKISALFLGELVLVDGTAAAVHESDFVIDLEAVKDKEPQRRD